MNEAVSFNIWDLPKDWKIDRLEDVTQKITDGAHFSPAPQEDGEIIVNVKDMGQYRIKYEGCTRITKKDFDFLVAQNCAPQTNDVLLSKDGTIGRVLLFDGSKDVVLLSSIAIIRPRGDIDPSYLRYVLSSFFFTKQLYSLQSGSALKRIVLADIKRLRVPFPAIEKQLKIAKILTTVDNLIEKTEALIEKYQAIKQGMMHDLFTRGIDTNGQLRPSRHDTPHLYKQTELGWIPKEWNVVRLADISEIKGGKRLPAGEDFAEGITPYPYIRVVDMIDGTIDDSALMYIKPETQKYISRYTISSSDLYVTIAGTIGLFGKTPKHLDGAQLTENAAKITNIDFSNVDLDYLCQYLRSQDTKPQVWKEIGTGGGVPKLALFRIETFLVKIPPLEEQENIAKRITLSTTKIKYENNYLEKLREVKKGLMQDLLTGKVRIV